MQPESFTLVGLSFGFTVLLTGALFWYSPTLITYRLSKNYYTVTPWAQLFGSFFGFFGGYFLAADMRFGFLFAPGSTMFAFGTAVLMRVKNINPDPKSLWEAETTGYALLVAGAVLMGLGIR
ncbi:hypothetical protein ACFQH6_04730 [Halobacteriaceae archaeon GCM10025711]